MLEGLQPNKDNRLKCKVRTVMNDLSEEDANLLRGYLADEATWSANALSNSLKELNVIVSANVIIKHRNKFCSC